MVDNVMLCLAPLSALVLGSVWLWAIYHSIKTHAWVQIVGGIALGFVSAFTMGWFHPAAFLLLPLSWIGAIHIIAERIKELS